MRTVICRHPKVSGHIKVVAVIGFQQLGEAIQETTVLL